MKIVFILLMCMTALSAYSQDNIHGISDWEMRFIHRPGRSLDDLLGSSTIVSVFSDKIEIKKGDKTIVITDKDSITNVRTIINDLFIEKTSPVILSKIEIDDTYKWSHYYPIGFSIYIPKTETRGINLIAAYSYDERRYVFSEKFIRLFKMLDK